MSSGDTTAYWYSYIHAHGSVQRSAHRLLQPPHGRIRGPPHQGMYTHTDTHTHTHTHVFHLSLFSPSASHSTSSWGRVTALHPEGEHSTSVSAACLTRVDLGVVSQNLYNTSDKTQRCYLSEFSFSCCAVRWRHPWLLRSPQQLLRRTPHQGKTVNLWHTYVKSSMSDLPWASWESQLSSSQNLDPRFLSWKTAFLRFLIDIVVQQTCNWDVQAPDLLDDTLCSSTAGRRAPSTAPTAPSAAPWPRYRICIHVAAIAMHAWSEFVKRDPFRMLRAGAWDSQFSIWVCWYLKQLTHWLHCAVQRLAGGLVRAPQQLLQRPSHQGKTTYTG